MDRITFTENKQKETQKQDIPQNSSVHMENKSQNIKKPYLLSLQSTSGTCNDTVFAVETLLVLGV